MANINNRPPRGPAWPWGGPRTVRERLVDPAQLDRKKALKKLGNPKAPALASSALLEFIAPAHSSEELRLPLPVAPEGHDADVETFLDRPHLITVASRQDADTKRGLERGMARLTATPDRLERMKALLNREGQMLTVVDQVAKEMREILRLMWDAQKDEHI
jgi:hypothetical protein